MKCFLYDKYQYVMAVNKAIGYLSRESIFVIVGRIIGKAYIMLK